MYCLSVYVSLLNTDQCTVCPKKRKKKKKKKKARVFTTWAGHVARMGEGGGVTGFWLGGPKVRDHLENIGEGGRITLSWTLGR